MHKLITQVSMSASILISSYMKQFKATVRASGMVVTTVVFATTVVEAQKILTTLFGVGNLVGTPSQIH
jgi:hypothetical protein